MFKIAKFLCEQSERNERRKVATLPKLNPVNCDTLSRDTRVQICFYLLLYSKCLYVHTCIIFTVFSKFILEICSFYEDSIFNRD